MPFRRLLNFYTSKPVLEWEVGEKSDATSIAWVPRATHLQASQTYRWSRRRLVLAVTLLLLVGFIAVAQLVYRAEQNVAQIEREIELATEAELWMANADRSQLMDSVQGVSSTAIVYSGEMKTQIQAIELHNDLAITRVFVDGIKLASVGANNAHAPGAKTAGYETWFYRQTEAGWMYTAAVETLWGPSQFIESSHFLFQYHQLDHRAIKEVMPAIEAFNADLYRDLGIDPLPDDEKVTIRITVNGGNQPIDPFFLSSSDSGIVVLSPRLLRVPATLNDADAIRQSIQTALAYRIILMALQQYKPQAAWQPVVDGLRQWAILAHNDLHFDLADELNTALRQQLLATTLPRLPVLSVPAPSMNPEETEVMRWTRNVVAKTVIDYAIATYGRASLARLLAGLRQYDTWQSLIPNVFGVSVNEFESGWQAYLATEYDLRY